MTKLAFIASVLASSIAFSDDEPTAADVAGAPEAGAESGRTDEADDGVALRLCDQFSWQRDIARSWAS